MINKLNILHISTDNFFIKSAYRIFEHNYPNQNTIWLFSLTKNKNSNTKYKKTFTLSESLNPLFLYRISKFDIIILHSLELYYYPFILLSSKKIKYIWIGWGYDYYDYIYKNPSDLLLKYTKEIKQKCNNKKIFSIRTLKDILLKPINFIYSIFIIEPTLKKIKSFSPVFIEDYILIKEANIIKNLPPYMSWNYGTLEDDYIHNVINKKIDGDSILVGNNATYTNNHFEVFKLLKSFKSIDYSKRKVIVPLSYGKSCYKNLIKIKGDNIFGASFEPLLKFLPYDEYITKLSSCGYLIMNHKRQQAVGIIILMMYLGSRIFLRNDCSTYLHFKRSGAVINTIEELARDETLLTTPLTNEEIDTNINILKNEWSRQMINDKTLKLVEYALTK